MSLLKDSTQLNFYLSTLERWKTIVTNTGTPAEILADLVLTYGYKQHQTLCREMSDHFGEELSNNKEGIKMIIEWLKKKYGMNKHADMVKVFNTFWNTTRPRAETLTDFISRFEKNYHEVKKMGETLSETCLSLLLLRQANLTDTDSQIITINLEFDPTSENAKKSFEMTKAAMTKFQHSRQANHQYHSGHSNTSKATGTFLAALEEDEDLDAEQIDSIRTFVAGVKRGGRGGGRGGRGGGGGGDRHTKKRVWKCDFCICSHLKYKECNCECMKHTRENCPNPDPAKVAAFKKRKAEVDSNRENRRRQDQPGAGAAGGSGGAERGFLSYANNFTEQLAAQEVDYEHSLLAKVVAETESKQFRPLSELFQALESQQSQPPTPASQPYDVQQGVLVLPGGAGEPLKVTNNLTDNSPANSIFSHDVNNMMIPGGDNNFTKQPAAQESDYEHIPPGKQEKVFLRADHGQEWHDTVQTSRETHKLSFLVDCGSPSNIVGVEDYKDLEHQYPEMIQSSFVYKESDKKYEFGGGEKTYSMGKVRLPIYVLDGDCQTHLLHVWVEVLNQKNLPLLLGGRSLLRAKSTLCFKNLTLSLDWKEKRLSLPIKEGQTGHFYLQFFPMSRQEDELLTREMVNRADWTVREIKNIVTYIANENNPQVSKIRAPEEIKINRKKKNKPLTKIQINRLHQALGHCHRDKLRDMVKKANMFDDNTLKFIDDLANCEVCAVEHSRLPRPRIAAPRANNFNHILALDLKENKRYKNSPPYILYFVDTFTRFKAAVFIKNKQSSTIAEHLVTEWIKLHGPPKYLMTDRGTEFNNGELRDLCQFHGIRFTSTASYSPHQNAYVERGHAVADRALERMITADPKLKPEVALCWVIQAVNTLQNVNGLTPFQLVFGRLPRHPTLVEDNPGANQELADSEATWARHYRMRMAAREAFTASEADRILRRALEQRVYTDPSKIKVKDWVYFRRNHERYWKGPAKLVMIDGKNLHCIFHGQPVVLNRDDVLLNKPETEEFTTEQFISLPQQSQPPTPVSQSYDEQQGVQVLPGGTGEPLQVTNSFPDISPANSVFPHDANNMMLPGGDQSGCQEHQGFEVPAEPTSQPVGSESGASQTSSQQPAGSVRREEQNPSQHQDTVPVTQTQSQGSDLGNQSPAVQPCQSQQQSECESSGLQCETQQIPHQYSAADLGTPLQCNLCEAETSSKNFVEHCSNAHNIARPSIRQHATVTKAKPDSIYENINELKKGAVVVDQDGNYLMLIKPTPMGWTTQNISTKVMADMELVKDMVDMRFIGTLESESEEGINVVNINKERTFVQFGDYTKKVFFTAPANYNEEQAYVVNIPRSKHGEPACVAAKLKELKDYENFEVFDIVDKPKDASVIATEWVLVEKEKLDGTKIIKARLCLRGDQEKSLHKIPRESPTVNKISIKILITIAVSQGWDVRSCDVERAFLQSDPIEREVYVRPPLELSLPNNKVLQLKKTAYGLVDASRAFYLKQAKELKNIGFHPLSMDPAMFVHKAKGQQMCDAGAAVHVDDALNAGRKEVLDLAQSQMRNKLKYGSVEKLPFRFLGSNYRKEQDGSIIIDQQHYVEALEIPDLSEMTKMSKKEVLPDQLQSVFRSLASKLNVLSSTSRPDFSYTTKYLTTRYNKATKSDMTTAVKLIKKAKEETTEIVIPNIGEPEKWILVGVVDASHRSSGNLFAVGGHVVMIQNKETLAAAVIHWSSKKIERIVHSSSAAETLAMQKMFSTIYLVRRILSEMCGNRVNALQCVALTDNQGLFSNIHHLKCTSEDYRLHSDIIELRQSIEQEKTVQEVRYVHSSLNLADCLTKVTKSGFMLLQLVRTGWYDTPGGTNIRDSTMTSVRTWNELMRVEMQDPDLERSSKSPVQPDSGSPVKSQENLSDVIFLGVATSETPPLTNNTHTRREEDEQASRRSKIKTCCCQYLIGCQTRPPAPDSMRLATTDQSIAWTGFQHHSSDQSARQAVPSSSQ